MPIVSTRWKCDRDNTEATSTGDQMPADWLRLNGMGSGILPMFAVLCPKCRGELLKFMGPIFAPMPALQPPLRR